ncbi:MAG: substrate-binding domain-containing protein [Acidimicrobiia bacterium]|nr:substrate-binding domain-containing protein [Acidimicrobiia bacterium]
MLTSPGMSPDLKRALALVAAVAMVGAAVIIRSSVFGDETDGGGNGRDDSAGPARLVCVTELEGACHDLADRLGDDISITVEDAGATAARLLNAATGNATGIDGWLTLSPWPKMIEDSRARSNARPILGAVSEPVARSPLVMVVRTDRAEALTPRCPDRNLGWRCLGDFAGRPWAELGGEATWGSVKLAHADAAGSASGALLVAQAVGHYLATPEIPVTAISRIDWESSDGFASWFQHLEGAVPRNGFDPPAGSPFAQFLQGRFVEYDAVAALEAEVAPALARASGLGDSVVVAYPEPVGTADVVFVSLLGSEGSARLVEVATGSEGSSALAAAGWRVDGEARAAGVADSPPLPNGNGLPSAGAIDALRALWEEVTR